MKFFKQLSETQITDVIIQFEKSETGEIIVFVAPKSITRGNPLKSLKPIFLSGNAEKIDLEFFNEIEKNMIDGPVKVSKAKQIKALSDSQPLEEKFEDIDNSVEPITEEKEQEFLAEEEARKQFDADEALELNDDFSKEEVEEVLEESPKEVKPKKEKVEKVNNEKPLKDFIASLGKDADILHQIPAIEELYAKLSSEELDKPFAKKVRIDMDIRLRKEANYQGALVKNGFKPKEESVLPKELQEIVNGSPNLYAVKMERVVSEIEIIEEEVKTEEKFIDINMQSNTSQIFENPIKISPEMQELVKTLPPEEEVFEVEVIEEESDFVLLSKDFTLEQYISIGWTKQSLVDAGRAKFVCPEIKTLTIPPAPIPVPPVPSSSKYTFPKPFDDMSEKEQEEEHKYRQSISESNPE